MAGDSHQYTKPTPMFTISDDDNDKVFRSRKGKKHKGRRRGGSGLR